LRHILIILAAAATVALPARAERFDVSPEAGDTRVVFESKAPMETFQGRTDRVSGTIDLEGGGEGAIAIRVAVDMASLDTGIALRNRHMCENHLHTDEHPQAVFEGAKIVEGDAAALAAGGDHDVTLEGDFTLHGVTRTIRVPARISRTSAGGAPRIRLDAEFEVTLADYGIPRPRMLMLKLNETQKVTVELWAAPAPAAAGGAPGTR
jgi:polyisoprenoid-binding protein YceI